MAEYGGRWAQLEHSTAGMAGGECRCAPVGIKEPAELLSDALDSVLEKVHSGASEAASFPIIRHCENIPLSVYFLITHLFVCLLIVLLLEQNVQWSMRLSLCLMVSALPRGRVTEPGLQTYEDGCERSSQKLLSLAQAQELSGCPWTPGLIKAGCHFGGS